MKKLIESYLSSNNYFLSVMSHEVMLYRVLQIQLQVHIPCDVSLEILHKVLTAISYVCARLCLCFRFLSHSFFLPVRLKLLKNAETLELVLGVSIGQAIKMVQSYVCT